MEGGRERDNVCALERKKEKEREAYGWKDKEYVQNEGGLHCKIEQ